jgi:cell division protein FtsA
VEGFGDVIGNPLHASGVGLLLHGARSGGSGVSGPIGGGMGGMFGKVRDWVTKNF